MIGTPAELRDLEEAQRVVRATDRAVRDLHARRPSIAANLLLDRDRCDADARGNLRLASRRAGGATLD